VRDGQRIAVVVPAYDEERLIADTLRSIPAFVDDVIVVDDGSSDATAERALAGGDRRVRVLRHEENRGVGAALISGYTAAFSAGADAVAVMAGDGQMDPRDLPALLSPVLSGRADYAKGDRLADPELRGRMPLLRRLGNRALSLLTRLCLGASLSDSQCGYTVLSRRAHERVRLEALWPRYGYPNDLLGRLLSAGMRVVDVPVRAVYGSEVSGVGLRHALFVVPFVIVRAALRGGRLQRAQLPTARALRSVAGEGGGE
jgi:glycosyltransferase involved in cell wall biosynthesis